MPILLNLRIHLWIQTFVLFAGLSTLAWPISYSYLEAHLCSFTSPLIIIRGSLRVILVACLSSVTKYIHTGLSKALLISWSYCTILFIFSSIIREDSILFTRHDLGSAHNSPFTWLNIMSPLSSRNFFRIVLCISNFGL